MYRLMSGSAANTAAAIAAMTPTLISVDIAVRPLFLLDCCCLLDLFNYLLCCADRRRPGLPYLVGQS